MSENNAKNDKCPCLKCNGEGWIDAPRTFDGEDRGYNWCPDCHGTRKTRAEEKQASRDEDQRRLDSGEVTREQLREENAVFSPKFIRESKMDLSKARRLA